MWDLPHQSTEFAPNPISAVGPAKGQNQITTQISVQSASETSWRTHFFRTALDLVCLRLMAKSRGVYNKHKRCERIISQEVWAESSAQAHNNVVGKMIVQQGSRWSIPIGPTGETEKGENHLPHFPSANHRSVGTSGVQKSSHITSIDGCSQFQ